MTSMSELLQHLINGITLGAMYSIMGVGFTLIFGIMEVLNFAYGQLFMFSAYTFLFLYSFFGGNFPPAAAITLTIYFLAGMLLEKTLVEPIQKKTPNWSIPVLMSTIGLGMVLENIALIAWGAIYRGIPYYFKGVLEFSSLRVSYDRLFILIVSVCTLLFTWFVVHKTKIGLAMRAVSQNRKAAALMGIDTNKVYMFTFGLSTALVALAGSLLIPILSVYPTVGSICGMKAFAVTLLGGIGSMEGAIISGFILGIVESITAGFISPFFVDMAAFLCIIIILVFFPRGIYGMLRRERK